MDKWQQDVRASTSACGNKVKVQRSGPEGVPANQWPGR